MSHSRSLTTWAGLAVAAVALIFAVPTTASAADVAKEIAAAEQHAGYAAGSKDLKMVQTHLHHVINCLVGPKGKGFDATQANPCKDLGNGVMPDYTGDKAGKAGLQKALTSARAGLKATKLEDAQKRATATDALLKKAMM